MADSTTTTSTTDKGLLGTIAGLFGAAQNTLENGIKTQVSVVFPATVYFDIFALVVFCTLAVVGINIAAKRLRA